MTASSPHLFPYCPFCRMSRVRYLLKPNALPCHIGVCRCPDCDLVFFEQVKAHNDYWRAPRHHEIYEEERDSEVEQFKRYWQQVETFKPSPGRLLEIGCGLGDFMELAASKGWRVEGIDPGLEAVEKIRKRSNLAVHHGFFEDIDLPENAYDCVTMWDVIEHLYEPARALEKVRRILKPGGLFAFKTPNEHSLFKRLALWGYRYSFGLVKFPLKYVYYIPHYYSYSPRTMELNLPRFGMNIRDIQYEETDRRFASKKIDLSYRKYIDMILIKCALPIVYSLARTLHMQNKMVIYAEKNPA